MIPQLLVAVIAGLAQLPVAAQAPLASDDAHRARLDAWVQAGWDAPDAALAALHANQPAPASAQRTSQNTAQHAAQQAAQRQAWTLAKGLVLAAAGRQAAAEGVVAALMAEPSTEPLAAAHASLLQAQLADNRSDGKAVLEAARSTLKVYERECPARPACDYRVQWRALMMVARYERSRGQTSTGLASAQSAAEVAKVQSDPVRNAWAMAQVADLTAAQGDVAQGQRLLGQAQRMAATAGSLHLLSRLQAFEAIGFARQGDTPAALRAARAGLRWAQQAKSPRLQALHLTNLSDSYVKSGRPLDALQAVQQALPIVQRFGNPRAQRTLTHNAALARVLLGQAHLARQAMQEVLQAYRDLGASAEEADALREFANAFAAAGDSRTALDLYHQERQLAATIMANNRDAAMAELRLRFDREAEQEQLEQLALASRLQSAQLDNRALLQKVWAAAAAVLVLAMALVALLYRRVRTINRSLSHNQAFLRAQSQRDPLTGLANRRGLHDVASHRGVTGSFSGALLLVDIDHFKHVNDGHGHAAGDCVLVEVSRRLSNVVRDDDVLARWGGEEFLIFMPNAGASQAQALAERVLQAVGAQPVPLATTGQALKVTVSVGYGAFPLAGARLPLSLERAINLADMALYTAKGQGRNRAIGVVSALADDDQSLKAMEADFDRAWHERRLTLQRSLGPASGEARPSRPTPLDEQHANPKTAAEVGPTP